MTYPSPRIIPLTYTYHALQRFAERVGDFRPPKTINLDNGQALLRKSQPEHGSAIYTVIDRGHRYRLVISESRQGAYVVLTVKPDSRQGYHPPSSRKAKQKYCRQRWKKDTPEDDDF